MDDDASLVKMLNTRLWAEGYETDLAISGASAIAIAREKNPDVILLDIALPGVTGVDVVQELESSDDGRGIPVIVMTAYPHMLDMVKGHPAVKECLLKPFDLARMVKRIEELIGAGPTTLDED